MTRLSRIFSNLSNKEVYLISIFSIVSGSTNKETRLFKLFSGVIEEKVRDSIVSNFYISELRNY